MKQHRLIAWPNGLGYTLKTQYGEWDIFRPLPHCDEIWKAVFHPFDTTASVRVGTGPTWPTAVLLAKPITA